MSQEPQCPVDQKSRELWLQQNRERSSNYGVNNTGETTRLSKEREISSIPRAAFTKPTAANESGRSANDSEHSKGQEDGQEFWVYPSERMFFDAMRRKKWDPNASEMSSIVPIHNAVNEEAWRKICEWEMGQGSEKCGGPKLAMFKGDASRISPKARLFSLLGYKLPFDRHDWTISRCSEQIDYVIEFYSARPGPNGEPGFYLDVRPKLNSWPAAILRLKSAFKIQSSPARS